MNANFFILYFLFFFSISGFCQKNHWTISGTVVGDKKLSAQGANVFVNNTSIGTTTNENGNFQLSIPDEYPQIELIVSMVGFKPIKRKIRYSAEIQVFKFQLESDTMPMEMIVSANHDKDWRKKWKVFERALIGDSKFAKDCKILNPNVVKLWYDKDKNLFASANEPILIQNTALGYKIVFQMDKFQSDGTTTHLSGLKFFKKIAANSLSLKTKWDKNRKEVFRESFRNFLMALAINKLEENDFEVFKRTDVQTALNGQTTVEKELNAGKLKRVEAYDISVYDKDAESFLLQSEYPILVFMKKSAELKPVFTDYPYKYSEIVLPKAYAGFNEHGWLGRPNDVVLRDYWGDKGLASQLPDDYYLEGSTKEPINPTTINKLSKRQ